MTAVWALGVVPAWANEARIIAERQIDTRVIELTISTPAFTAPTKVDVDLPMGYNDDPNRRWPVTYYLAGDTHHYGDFNTEYDGERLTRSFPSIVVSPNGNSGWWSDWYNFGAFGPPMYETYVVDQLTPDRRPLSHDRESLRPRGDGRVDGWLRRGDVRGPSPRSVRGRLDPLRCG